MTTRRAKRPMDDANHTPRSKSKKSTERHGKRRFPKNTSRQLEFDDDVSTRMSIKELSESLRSSRQSIKYNERFLQGISENEKSNRPCVAEAEQLGLHGSLLGNRDELSVEVDEVIVSVKLKPSRKALSRRNKLKRNNRDKKNERRTRKVSSATFIKSTSMNDDVVKPLDSGAMSLSLDETSHHSSIMGDDSISVAEIFSMQNWDDEILSSGPLLEDSYEFSFGTGFVDMCQVNSLLDGPPNAQELEISDDSSVESYSTSSSDISLSCMHEGLGLLQFVPGEENNMKIIRFDTVNVAGRHDRMSNLNVFNIADGVQRTKKSKTATAKEKEQLQTYNKDKSLASASTKGGRFTNTIKSKVESLMMSTAFSNSVGSIKQRLARI